MPPSPRCAPARLQPAPRPQRRRAPFQVVPPTALHHAALVAKLKAAAVSAGWSEPPPVDGDVALPDAAALLAGGSGAAPAPAAAQPEDSEGDLDTAQIAALSVSALHEKIQSSLENGAIGGYADIYRALDEPGAGWFEGSHLAAVCAEIDIPTEEAIIPHMMALIAEPAGRQRPQQAGGITKITWDEFKVFCTQSRPVLG